MNALTLPGDGLWPTEFAWGEALPPPTAWATPGLVMFFNLECAGCVARGVPFLKRSVAEHGDALTALLIHTAYGHRHLHREAVVPTLTHFAGSFARLTVPVALDLSGKIGEGWGVEGTPHWFVFAPGGALLRSIYGSQDNAQTRLSYLLEEVLVDNR